MVTECSASSSSPMEKFSHVLVFAVVTVGGLAQAPLPPTGSPGPVHTDANGGLLLTPYITSNDPNQLRVAKKLSAVQPFLQFPNVTSYAGYITVDQATNSNLYFNFVTAEVDPKNAPVLLVLNGGPGVTTLSILYNGFGPFQVDSDQNLVKNSCTYSTKFNIIYLDTPAGGGYSYTNSYATNDSQVGQQIYTFLDQFFTLFDEYSPNDFYILGGSYGGKFAVETSLPIIKNKGSNPSPKDPIRFNFKGILTMSGFLDPPKMIQTADTLYCNGLINEVERDNLTQQIDLALEMIAINKTAAVTIFVIATVIVAPSFYGKIEPDSPNFYLDFIQTADYRARFHLGENTFHNDQEQLLPLRLALADTFLSPTTTGVETILNNKYKVCLVNGQRDLIVPIVPAMEFISGLQWYGAVDYNVTPRVIWTAPNETIVSGYVTQAFNLWNIMISNAGHGAIPLANPCIAWEAIERFIYNKTF